MTNRMTTIIRHEGVKDSGSYEVKFSDGRPPKFFNWDDDPNQRVRPGVLTSEQALEKARAFADAERDKGHAMQFAAGPPWLLKFPLPGP